MNQLQQLRFCLIVLGVAVLLLSIAVARLTLASSRHEEQIRRLYDNDHGLLGAIAKCIDDRREADARLNGYLPGFND